MKKGKLFLAIVAAIALVGCNEPISNSNSSSAPSTSTSIVEKFKVEVVNGTGGGDEIAAGSSVTVIANEPAEGQKFVKWIDESGNEVSSEKSYTFVVTKDVKLTATYEKFKFQVKITDGSGSGEYEYGDTVTATADVAKGKEFVAWVDASGAEVSTTNPYIFEAKSDVTLFAEFKEAYYNPQDIDELKTMLPKIAKAQAKTASMIVTIDDPGYTSYSTIGTNETITMYKNAVIAVGTDKLYSTNYPITREIKKTDTHLLTMNIFESTSRTSTAVAQKIVDSVSDESSASQISTSYANEMINSYGLVTILSNFLNSDQCENVTEFVTSDNEANHTITIKSQYDIANYSGSITIKAYVTTNITIDDEYYITALSFEKKQYVIATQFNPDGTLKDDATAKTTYNATYSSTKLVGEKSDLPEEEDMSSKYYISDFEISGRYYEGSATRYITENSKNVPLNQAISVSYIEPATGTIVPTTSLEKKSLTLVGISNQSVIRPGTALDTTIDPNKDLSEYTSIYTVGLGDCTLTFETSAGLRKEITLTVKEKLPPVSFEVTCEDVVLVDAQIEVNVQNIKPSTSEDKFVWSVSDDTLAEIVKIDDKVYLKGKKIGFVDVIAKAENDESITAQKTVYVSGGPLMTDELELLLGGSTWYAEKSTYSHTGFTFTFEDDGTFSVVDNYRSPSARITGTGRWSLTTELDSDQTHSDGFNTLGDDYYIIVIEDFTTTESVGYYCEIHLAIAKDGHELIYHFIPESSAASTQSGNAKKIA